MFFLAGLMGVIAVGAAMYVDIESSVGSEPKNPKGVASDKPDDHMTTDDQQSCAGDDDEFGLFESDGNDPPAGDNRDEAIFSEDADDQLRGAAASEIKDDWETPGVDDTLGQNSLDAGDGESLIGQDEIVYPCDDEGTVDLSDWIGERLTAEIFDFSPDEDQLLFIWDDTRPGSEPPDFSVTPDPDQVGRLQVRSGDVVLAHVEGELALDSAELSLMPLSSAQALGLAG